MTGFVSTLTLFATTIVKSAPEIHSVVIPGQQSMVVEITGTVSDDYELWHSPDFMVGWIPISLPSGTTTPAQFRFPVAPGTTQFAWLANPAMIAAAPAPLPVSITALQHPTSTCDAEYRHDQTGRVDVFFLGYGWDVDTSANLDFSEVEARVNTAGSITAPLGGLTHQYLMPFHHWPNIINLTAVRAADETFYNTLINALLSYGPAPQASSVSSHLHQAITNGDRVFLIRDFIDQVVTDCGTPHFEVHFAAIINLDGREAFEIQAHAREHEGLGTLRDPAIAELELILNTTNSPGSAGVMQEVWELCLRGNTKRHRYNAVNVDAYCAPSGSVACDPSAPAYFSIKRVDLTCGTGRGSTLESPPFDPEDIPCRMVWIPPAFKIPPIVEWPIIPGPGPGPGNGGGGNGGGNGGGGGDGAGGGDGPPPPPGVGPGGDASPPWPYPDREEPPEGDGPAEGGDVIPPADGSGTGPCPTNDPEIRGMAEALLEEVIARLEEKAAIFNEDINMRNHNFRRNWPPSWVEIGFNCPEIQAIYEDYKAQIEALQAQIKALYEQMREEFRDIREMRDTMPLHILLAAGWRESAWSNMLEVGGEWSRVTGHCQILIQTALPTDPVLVGTDAQLTYQRTLAHGLMHGKSYDEAMAEAAKEAADGDVLLEMAFQQYGDCLKDIHIRALREFFQGDQRPEGDMDRIIDAMLNGRSALTDADKAELDGYRDFVRETQEGWEDIREQIRELEREINRLRRAFLDAISPIFAEKREEVRRCQQKRWILEGFNHFVADGWNNPESFPVYLAGPEGHARFCSVLAEMLADPATDDVPCLREFLQALLDANC